MEALTFLFVLFLLVVAVILINTVRRDFAAGEEIERERRRQLARRQREQRR